MTASSTASSTASIYQGLKAAETWSSTTSLIDTLSVEVYGIQFFRADFHQICGYMVGFSFLITLDIYKDYFKGCKRWHKLRECRAKFCSCKLWSETKFDLVHLSLEEAVVFVHLRDLWPRSLLIFIEWWTEKLCCQHPFQVDA